MRTTRRTRILFTLLSAILLVSLGMNGVLYLRGRMYYHQLNQVRLDPLGLSVYPAEAVPPPQSEGAPIRVVFLGDSRAAAWPAPVRLDGFEFINRGIGAETTAQTLARYDAHVSPLYADILIVQAGINDLKTIPLFPERQEAIIQSVKMNLAEIVQRALDQDMRVVLTTIIPEGQIPLERRLFWSDGVKQGIDEVNAYLTSLEGEQITVIDTGKVLAGSDGLVRSEYRYDFLHLNEKGYEALNEELKEVLTAIQK